MKRWRLGTGRRACSLRWKCSGRLGCRRLRARRKRRWVEPIAGCAGCAEEWRWAGWRRLTFWICTYGGWAEIGFIYLIVRILGTFNLRSGGSTSTQGSCGSELVKVWCEWLISIVRQARRRMLVVRASSIMLCFYGRKGRQRFNMSERGEWVCATWSVEDFSLSLRGLFLDVFNMPTAPSRCSLGSVNKIICGREIRTQILGKCLLSPSSSPQRYELARATRLELSFLYWFCPRVYVIENWWMGISLYSCQRG